MAQIRPGVYRHFKGNEYELIGFARHSETLEDMVIYKALYGAGRVWVRPASMWDEVVEVSGAKQRRFTYIGARPEAVLVKEVSQGDFSFLESFLYDALFLPFGTDPPRRDVIYKSEIYIYIDGFGSKAGDVCVVAERDGKLVGAAWTRIIPAYGHVDDDTPELAMSVLAGYRKQGIGTALLLRLFKVLKERGYKQTSLSVQKKNPATRLYKRVGYEVSRENNEDLIMVKIL